MQQTQLIIVGAKDAHWLLNDGMELKTNSPKRVVTIVHFTTISGHFLANLFNIFPKLRIY